MSGGRWGQISYAQHGDDFMAVNIFELLGIEKPGYLEIGAYDPVDISNTALLHKRGSVGTVVDASAESLKRFEAARPSDRRLHAAVVPAPRMVPTIPFYRVDPHHGLNTCDLHEAQTRGTPIRDNILVPALTLDEIVALCPYGIYPHFLSVDIEGYDFDVLNTSRFSGDCAPWGPILICVEVRKEQSHKFMVMMREKGYMPLIRMAENMFFIRKPLYEKVF